MNQVLIMSPEEKSVSTFNVPTDRLLAATQLFLDTKRADFDKKIERLVAEEMAKPPSFIDRLLRAKPMTRELALHKLRSIRWYRVEDYLGMSPLDFHELEHTRQTAAVHELNALAHSAAVAGIDTVALTREDAKVIGRYLQRVVAYVPAQAN